MAQFQNLKPGNKKYLIIAAMPTPNGRLHLGHMSGPYLKTDIIARAQRRNGNDVCVISGCDAYESYVPLKAWQTGMTEPEVCKHYSGLSLKDLSSLGVQYDAYVNPVASLTKEDFSSFAKDMMQDLIDKGLTEVRPEKFLYSPSGDRYLVGCWLLGECPNCGVEAGSYQCEDCGTQFRPMDMKNPHSRAGDTDLEEIDDVSLFLKITKKKELWDHIDKMQIGDDFKEIVKVYFESQGDYIRLTNPDHWGVPWQIEGSNIPQVIYSATYMNAYMVYMGEIYAKLYDNDINPFHPDSDVISMVSFGIDCSIPYILGMSWGIESGDFKPIDYALPNHFCNLEDSKFSTSRGHAIWGDDIVSKTPLSSDAVRYYLVQINPEHKTTSFQIEPFIETVNRELTTNLQGQLDDAWSKVNQLPDDLPSSFPTGKLEQLLIDQGEYLRPPGLEMAKGLEPLNSWLEIYSEHARNPTSAYWWLKGFALLAYPIMPDCSGAIWNLLGHEAQPTEVEFFEKPIVQHEEDLPTFFEPVSLGQIEHVLPDTLFDKAQQSS